MKAQRVFRELGRACRLVVPNGRCAPLRPRKLRRPVQLAQHAPTRTRNSAHGIPNPSPAIRVHRFISTDICENGHIHSASVSTRPNCTPVQWRHARHCDQVWRPDILRPQIDHLSSVTEAARCLRHNCKCEWHSVSTRITKLQIEADQSEL